jgi:integrating conjugative element protein (TIGR03759 family)
MLKPVYAFILGVLSFWHVQAFASDFRNSDQTVTTHSSTQSAPSIPIKDLAAKWKLSEQEYTRYLEIMKGPLGHWNENIDPVFALGMFAESQAEQRRYAELLARQEYQLAQRTIEFERAYRLAFQRLYPNASMVNEQLLQPYYQKHGKYSPDSSSTPLAATESVLQIGDRLLYFADPKNCSRCMEDINSLAALARSGIGIMIDVYVVNAGNSDDVNRWANQYKLDAGLVGSTITLNPDNGLYQKIAVANGKNSGNIFLSRGNQLYRIDADELREWRP